jgi:hypothetical protein
MMKHIFRISILLSFVLLSCTDEADTNESVTRAVCFHTADVRPQGDPTRAAAMNTSDLHARGFTVNAYATGAYTWASAKDGARPEFMFNQQVTWDTGKGAWTYGTAKFWPANNGMVSFFAWSDGTGASLPSKNVSGPPVITSYTVPDAQADQRDLVAAAAKDRTAADGDVMLTFGHILSRIGFKAGLDYAYSGLTIAITSLKVKYADHGVEADGDYTFGTGWWQNHARWMPHTGGGDEVVATGGVTLTKSLQRVNGTDKYLMLLPQPVTLGAVKIDVTWTVNGTLHNKTVDLPAQTWQPGYHYDYNLTLAEQGTKITLAPVSVNPWEDNAPHKIYTITYKANGGEGEDYVDYALNNTTRPVAGQIFGREFYYIGSWWAAETGATYPIGAKPTITQDLTLYAQWKPDLANCYMVKPGESTRFMVLRAYDADGQSTNTLRTGGEYTEDFEAAVLWDDNNVINGTPGVSGTGRTAVVSVKTNYNSGNAVVKIYKKDDATATPVWSYHIWVTTYPGDNTVTMKNGHVFMDRNLGATTNDLAPTAYGLLYQWGRKDPFAGGVENSAGYAALNRFNFGYTNKVTNTSYSAANRAKGIVESIQNPTKFYAAIDYHWLPGYQTGLWCPSDNTKSIYDPCPLGWRVTNNAYNYDSGSPWREYTPTYYQTELQSPDGHRWQDTGFRFAHKTGEIIYYPACGWRAGINGGEVIWPGAQGYYWTNKDGPDATAVHSLILEAHQVIYGFQNMASGASVRCVLE